ncbi:general transcription factor IIF subunit 2-like isoform X1 [Telopea speciosissima]|uniref:general transcription factor IIF subunit 2-like isoform X1 n=1 Tax=Telopea speciosissima TaxID=54955 RepID=UPI001CC81C55|nr:general transcription factor IIF subunit 2-like isoform X1 [Telopea speciosissima]
MVMGEKSSHENLLETAKADRAVWLMKFPPVVSRSWQSLTDSTRPLAKVVLSVDPLRSSDDDDNSSPQFTMELNGNESENVPKRYSLDMSTDFIPICVFSQTSQGKVSVEGKVLNKFDMKPHNKDIGNYGKLCRERTTKYSTKARQVQVIDDNRGVHMRPMPLGLLPSGAKDKKKTVPVKGSEMKRTRRDRGEMEDIMFKLFERQPNWTLRQLIQETDQPEQFVKDLLKELCVYNNKGTNQGSYELKPEYKRSGEEAGPG